ncbi:hypothetical protein ILUMI_26162 [Ignelater luminosus]|uniref:Tc1-like transposase DDE domain-containing protein n=1 Tax=Ignelater luminosus TaxID=2038154 RepID=A0A8K0FXH3_IGNLU|nr:hypothetical protein ILUMI_26162 [Ignelater luminosus]
MELKVKLLKKIEEKKLKWAGHMLRMDANLQVETVWSARAIEKNRRRGPRQTWNNSVKEILKKRGKTWAEAKVIAELGVDRQNKRYNENLMAPRVVFEQVVSEGNIINAARYKKRRLLPIVVPFAQNLGDDFIFVDDNVRPHRAELVKNFLQEHQITRMAWSAWSLDSSLIEHVWDKLKRLLSCRQHAPQSIQELNKVSEEWEALTQEFLNNLISNIPRRCREVHRKRGGPH